jgi:pantetheine-phosphate adenylyltransferase
MKQKGLALYPGSFDPFTYGHQGILERACQLFDHVEVTVAQNSEKHGFFSTEERKQLVEACTGHLNNVSVAVFEGLLVDYAKAQGAIALVRGLRQVSDFDYEFRMAFANRRLAPEVETVFLRFIDMTETFRHSCRRQCRKPWPPADSTSPLILIYSICESLALLQRPRRIDAAIGHIGHDRCSQIQDPRRPSSHWSFGRRT